MRIKEATITDAKLVYEITQTTIQETYPSYYPKEVVTFFSNHHTQEGIDEDCEKRNTFLLLDDEIAVATGSIHENEICRVFVLPKYQGQGYGKQIMNHLEKIIAKSYSYARIDSSLPGSFFYEKRNYKPIGHNSILTSNHVYLVYEIMEKILPKCTQPFSYDGKYFIAKQNSNH